MFIFASKNLISFFFKKKEIKREFTRKLSNFNPQWTKTLYQNNLKNIAFFLHFFRPKDVISHHQRKFLKGVRENEGQISQELWKHR